jgi:hypothetical protein
MKRNRAWIEKFLSFKEIESFERVRERGRASLSKNESKLHLFLFPVGQIVRSEYPLSHDDFLRLAEY